MNCSDLSTIRRANEEAIFNLYLYLAHNAIPEENETLKSVTAKIENTFAFKTPSEHDVKRLNILKNAVSSNSYLANSEISDLVISKDGLTASVFKRPDGAFSVVFKGTGCGEWIDNGKGLSGIPEENTYVYYNNKEPYHRTIKNDYATDQQVEALNLFRRLVAEKGLCSNTDITVSGHSKGGNKAQFITICSDLVDECFSFNGQGFSPEAINLFKKKFDPEFSNRCAKIKNISACNDYVNVLGKKLALSENTCYHETHKGLHYIEFMLNDNGSLNPPCKQGKLSLYVESVSDELMSYPPFIRKYATLGVMNVFQKYLGSETAINGDSVSLENTIAGLAVTIGAVIKRK